MNWYTNDLFQILAEMGEQDVRTKLAEGGFSADKLPIVHEWLRQREELRTEAESSRREERELQSNAIAREANKTAIEALRIARHEKTIAIIAAVAAIIPIFLSPNR